MCHLLQCKLLWDPHGWLSSTSTTNRDRVGPERQRKRQRSDRDLETLPVFIFSQWDFLWKLHWEVVLWTQASHFSFMKMWFPSSPLFLSAAHSTWSCWDPLHLHSGSLWWEGWTPLSSTLRGWLFFFLSNYHITAALAGVEKSPLALTVIILLGELR